MNLDIKQIDSQTQKTNLVTKAGEGQIRSIGLTDTNYYT